MKHTWRDSAKSIIADTIKNIDVTTTTEKEFRKILRNAYPFGERAYHPYKVWCDQVNRTVAVFYKTGKGIKPADMNQGELF